MHVDLSWILALLSLLFFLQTSLSAGTTVRCWPPRLPDDHLSIEDCLFLLTHLPSNPLNPNSTTTPPFSPSLPFLPRAYLVHASCAADMVWTMKDHPDTTPQLPLIYAGPPVVEIFESMKNAGAHVITDCLESGTYVGGTVEGQMAGNLGWRIRLEARNRDRLWKYLLMKLRERTSERTQYLSSLRNAWGFILLDV